MTQENIHLHIDVVLIEALILAKFFVLGNSTMRASLATKSRQSHQRNE